MKDGKGDGEENGTTDVSKSLFLFLFLVPTWGHMIWLAAAAAAAACTDCWRPPFHHSAAAHHRTVSSDAPATT